MVNKRTTWYCFNCVIDGIITTISYKIIIHKIVHVTNSIRRRTFCASKTEYHFTVRHNTNMTAYNPNELQYFLFANDFFLVGFQAPRAFIAHKHTRTAHSTPIEYTLLSTHSAESSSEWFEHKRSANEARVRVRAIVRHTAQRITVNVRRTPPNQIPIQTTPLYLLISLKRGNYSSEKLSIATYFTCVIWFRSSDVKQFAQAHIHLTNKYDKHQSLEYLLRHTYSASVYLPNELSQKLV